MKIKELIEKKSNGYFKIDEYTTDLGAIIFDDSKGGSVSNSYFFRFNKNVGEKIGSDNSYRQAGSFIDFYINEQNHCFQFIDFVLLKLFDIQIEESLTFEIEGRFYEPVIDISTWVSPFGGCKNFEYDNEDKKFLYLEDQINVKVIHNDKDIIQFVFGNLTRKIPLNEQICIYVDDLMNLSAIVIYDEVEVEKLIKAMK